MAKHKPVDSPSLSRLKTRELIYEPATASFVEPTKFKPANSRRHSSAKTSFFLYCCLLAFVSALFLYTGSFP